MTEIETVAALAALAQVQRLRAFRALVVAGPEGLTPSVIAAQLGIAPNALSFHLKELNHAGLVAIEPHGGVTAVSLWLAFYGPDAEALAERDAPRWQAWVDELIAGATAD